jgi:hypothetical protein
MKIHFLLLALFLSIQAISQNTITGIVKDRSGELIVGANVYIENTYDGTSSDIKGQFSFVTSAKGKQNLIVTFIGYENYRRVMSVNDMKNLVVVLKKSVQSIDAVTVTAGTFGTVQNEKIKALSTLDVLSTAGSMGDYLAGFKTLPGTSSVQEDGRLFIRGGDGYESQTFIDGMRVFKPYTETAKGIPSRAKYSPTLFKGMIFNTGGYSAEYGQALSGILLLDAKDQVIQTETNLSIMTVGASVEHARKWKKNSISATASYQNLAAYYHFVPNRYSWKKSPERKNGELSFRHKFKKGLLKAYFSYGKSVYKVIQDQNNKSVSYEQSNNDLYGNLSYKGNWGGRWSIQTGVSYSINDDDSRRLDQKKKTNENAAHLKIKLSYYPQERLRINFGAEQFLERGEREFIDPDYVNILQQKSDVDLTSVFMETNWFMSSQTVFSLGFRAEYENINKNWKYMPRLSMAQKVGKKGQFSLAYGIFYQLPQKQYLYQIKNIEIEQSHQYILNYQWNRKNQFLRAELYYKKYYDLIKWNAAKNYNNSGYGDAKGFDLYWKDNRSIQNLQYSISYSYIDTKRNQQDYPYAVQPNYVTNHNFSLVTKYYISKLKSQLGLTYSFASGRPYNNPNKDRFMSEKTRAFHTLDFGWAWLISPQTIFYCSASNVLGSKHVYAYRYSKPEGLNYSCQQEAVRPAAKRFFFMGLFITISSDKNKNQLDRL